MLWLIQNFMESLKTLQKHYLQALIVSQIFLYEESKWMCYNSVVNSLLKWLCQFQIQLWENLLAAFSAHYRDYCGT